MIGPHAHSRDSADGAVDFDCGFGRVNLFAELWNVDCHFAPDLLRVCHSYLSGAPVRLLPLLMLWDSKLMGVEPKRALGIVTSIKISWRLIWRHMGGFSVFLVFLALLQVWRSFSLDFVPWSG